MGPTQASSVLIKTTIEQGSRLSSQQVIRIPLQHLARTIQAMHSKGIAIESIDMGFAASSGSGHMGKTSPKVASSKEDNSEKSSKRAGRKRRQ
jgi:hypothetical protein